MAFLHREQQEAEIKVGVEFQGKDVIAIAEDVELNAWLDRIYQSEPAGPTLSSLESLIHEAMLNSKRINRQT